MDEDRILQSLMAEYCDMLGAAYLAEAKRLNNDPTFEFPESLHQRCIDTIRRELGKHKDP